MDEFDLTSKMWDIRGTSNVLVILCKTSSSLKGAEL